MKENLKKCPCCKEETLEFSQNADIRFYVGTNGGLKPILDENSIGWLDSTSLYCSNCGASDDDSDEINKLKKQYENLF